MTITSDASETMVSRTILAEPLTALTEAPVARSQRIAALDVLRGFALLGILVLNIEDFSGPESLHDIPVGVAHPAFVGWHAHLDLLILTLKWMFFEGKMRALFGTLFGAGCVLLTQRIERRRPDASADIYLRRCMWLFLFGLIHGTLIWDGDILLQYATVALLCLYPLRHVVAQKLIVVGLAVSLLGGTLGVANFVYQPAVFREDTLQQQALTDTQAGTPLSAEEKAAIAAVATREASERANIQEEVAVAHQGYLAVLPEQARGFFEFTAALFRTGWILEVVGIMIFGMGLYKTGFLSASRSARLYATTAVLGYAVSMPIVLTGVHQASLQGFSQAAALKWMYLPYGLQQIPAMLANASVILLMVRLGWLSGLQRALAAVGRTAFSNYIGTSLLCRFLFIWGPWHLYGTLEYYQQIYVVAGVWTVNILASTLWLRSFAYGPLEWMWRSLTYWKAQPFRLGSPAIAAG